MYSPASSSGRLSRSSERWLRGASQVTSSHPHVERRIIIVRPRLAGQVLRVLVWKKKLLLSA
jgi:hypothetical protein